jgi:predicted nucleic acid-binding protein
MTLMPYKAIHISDYAFEAKDEVLFDANIWLFIYGTYIPPSDPRVSIYSKAYSRALHAKCRVYLDSLVASEFVNRYARLLHQLFTGAVLDTPSAYKEFRESANFTGVAQQIASDLRRITGNCQRIESGFRGLDISALLIKFEAGKLDFNDLIFAELCESRNLMFVTHDKDFRGVNTTVLTANGKLLT